MYSCRLSPVSTHSLNVGQAVLIGSSCLSAHKPSAAKTVGRHGVSGIPSILFGISDTGGGHRSGAVAIDAALEQLCGANTQRHFADILASTGVPLIRDAPDLYDQLSTRWLPFYDLMFQLTDGRYRIDALTQFVYLSAHRNIVRVLEATRPDLVV